MRPRWFLSLRADSEIMTVITNTFYLYQDYNHILFLFWTVGFSQEKRELWNTKMLLSFWKKTEYSFFFVLPQDIHIFQLPSKSRVCIFKRCRVIQPGTWDSNQGEKDSKCSAKYSCLAQEAQPERLPSQNNMKCLDTCVQIVDDLPSVSKIKNDLKQNHMFYSFSRTAILFSHTISSFPFPENYSFLIHLFK